MAASDASFIGGATSSPFTADEALEKFGLAAVMRAVWAAAQDNRTRAGIVIELIKTGVAQVEVAELVGLSPSMIGKLARKGFAELSHQEQSIATFAFRDHQRSRTERFWDFVFPEPNTGCWLYVGNDNGHGYGIFGVGKGQKYAHRLAYEEIVGPIPTGLGLDHKCYLRCCVNPSHLEPVTGAENQRRAADRRRRQRRNLLASEGQATTKAHNQAKVDHHGSVLPVPRSSREAD